MTPADARAAYAGAALTALGAGLGAGWWLALVVAGVLLIAFSIVPTRRG